MVGAEEVQWECTWEWVYTRLFCTVAQVMHCSRALHLSGTVHIVDMTDLCVNDDNFLSGSHKCFLWVRSLSILLQCFSDRWKWSLLRKGYLKIRSKVSNGQALVPRMWVLCVGEWRGTCWLGCLVSKGSRWGFWRHKLESFQTFNFHSAETSGRRTRTRVRRSRHLLRYKFRECQTPQ